MTPVIRFGGGGGGGGDVGAPSDLARDQGNPERV